MAREDMALQVPLLKYPFSNDPCPMNPGKNSNKIAMNHLHRNKMESCGNKLNKNEFFIS